MNARKFVELWKREHDDLLRAFFESGSETAVAKAVTGLELTEEQTSKLRGVMQLALTDTFYTLLLGLDGEASIGGQQTCYTILDEESNPVSTSGEIEAEAFRQFHEESSA